MGYTALFLLIYYHLVGRVMVSRTDNAGSTVSFQRIMSNLNVSRFKKVLLYEDSS